VALPFHNVSTENRIPDPLFSRATPEKTSTDSRSSFFTAEEILSSGSRPRHQQALAVVDDKKRKIAEQAIRNTFVIRPFQQLR
jgi:hypothetical protein